VKAGRAHLLLRFKETRAARRCSGRHTNAKAIVPLADPGTWRYSIDGPESTLECRALLPDILDGLCHRRGNAVYCDTATRLLGLHTAPPWIAFRDTPAVDEMRSSV
jgi:hypothetical protein